MGKNPFQVGQPVVGDDFFGRQKILTDILDDREFSHAWVVGMRRSGKTSLLRHIVHLVCHTDAYSQRYIPIYWDMQSIKDVDELHVRLIKGLHSLYREKQQLFSCLGCSLQQAEHMKLPELFHHIEKVLSSSDKQILLLCDEAESLVNLDEEEEYVFGVLRQCVLGEWNRLVIAATGGFWNLQERQKDTFPLLKEFASHRHRYPLKQLTHDEAIALIRKGERLDSDFHIPRGWEEDICELTHKIPFYIQLFCMVLYETRPENFENAVKSTFESYDFNLVLNNDLEGLQIIEQLVLLHIVEKPGIARSEIETKLHQDVRIGKIYEFIDNLMKLGYIREVEQQCYDVQNHFLQLWYSQNLRGFVEKSQPYDSVKNVKRLIHFFKTKGDIETAIECAQRLLRKQPDCEVYYELGLMYRQQEKAPEAIKALQQALQLLSGDDDSLEKAQQEKARITVNLALAYRMMGEHEQYKACFREAFELHPETAFKAFEHQRQRAELAQQARKEAEQRQKQAEERQQREAIQIDTQKKMLSFLTHTLANTLAGGQPTVEEMLEIVRKDLGEQFHKRAVYNLVHDLTGLHTIFTVVSNMLTTYKLYINEPVAVMQAWKSDVGTKVSLKYLFALVFRQVVARMMFEERYKEAFKELVAMQSTYSLKECKIAFFKNVLHTELSAGNEEAVFQWLNTYFPSIECHLHDVDIEMSVKGLRFNILFACFAEIVYNALKYTDRQQSIRIEWRHYDQAFHFVCQNTFAQSSVGLKESQKGFDFIQSLADMVDGMEFQCHIQENVFTSRLHLQETLLAEGECV